jgi:hypothetical protein
MSDTKELVQRACAAAGNISTVELAALLGVDRSNLYRANLSKPLRNAVLQVINGASAAPATPSTNGNGAEPATVPAIPVIPVTPAAATTDNVFDRVTSTKPLAKRIDAFVGDKTFQPATREAALELITIAATLAAENELSYSDAAPRVFDVKVFNAVEVNLFRRRRVEWQEQLAVVVAAATFCSVFAIPKKNNLRFAGTVQGVRLALYVYARLVTFAENQSMKDRTKYWGAMFKQNGHRRGLQGFRPEWLEKFADECAQAAGAAKYQVADAQDGGTTMALAALQQRLELVADAVSKTEGVLVESSF